MPRTKIEKATGEDGNSVEVEVIESRDTELELDIEATDSEFVGNEEASADTDEAVVHRTAEDHFGPVIDTFYSSNFLGVVPGRLVASTFSWHADGTISATIHDSQPGSEFDGQVHSISPNAKVYKQVMVQFEDNHRAANQAREDNTANPFGNIKV